MKTKNRKPLGLEALEDRWVPATVRFDGSNLYVTNPLIIAGKSSISVVEGTGNAFTVSDNGTPNGVFAVTGNITIQGNNAKDTITVTPNATGLLGNLAVTAGNGAASVAIDGGAVGAFIAGNTRVNLGLGSGSKVAIGNNNAGSGTGLALRGSVSATNRSSGTSSITVGGGAFNTTFVGSQLSIQGFPTVTMGGKGDVFAGGISIGNTANSQTSVVTLVAGSRDAGNFNLQGGQGATTVLLNASVLGTASLNLGNNTNLLFLGGVLASPVTIGNLFYSGGNGNNALIVTGVANSNTVLGNVQLNWGNGANSFGASTGLTINGNLSVLNGNGKLDVTTSPFQGNVFGNINIYTGNGTNSFTFDGTNGATVFGTFTYTGGNGGNSVTVTNAPAGGGANLINLNVRFGTNNANLFTLGTAGVPPAAGTITGFITWAVPTAFIAGANAYVDNGYVFNTPIVLTNVPS